MKGTTRASLAPLSGANLYGETTHGPGLPVWVAVVHLKAGALKTSVRADSSGSRGRNEEPESLGTVLLERSASPQVGDLLTILGVTYEVTKVEIRFDVTGRHDHWQVDLGTRST